MLLFSFKVMAPSAGLAYSLIILHFSFVYYYGNAAVHNYPFHAAPYGRWDDKDDYPETGCSVIDVSLAVLHQSTDAKCTLLMCLHLSKTKEHAKRASVGQKASWRQEQ